ncbi:apolipoprotein N-acyltransferase [Enterobacter cloacae]
MALPFSFHNMWFISIFCFMYLFHIFNCYAVKYVVIHTFAWYISFYSFAGLNLYPSVSYLSGVPLAEFIVLIVLTCYSTFPLCSLYFFFNRISLSYRYLFPVYVSALEMFRSEIFSWASVYYSQVDNYVIFLAEYFGGYVVSFLIVLIAVSVYSKFVKIIFLLVMPSIFLLSYIPKDIGDSEYDIRVSLVTTGNLNYFFNDMINISIDELPFTDLIIWPENSFLVNDEKNRMILNGLKSAAIDYGVEVIYTGFFKEGGYNFLRLQTLTDNQKYDKTILVPFVESNLLGLPDRAYSLMPASNNINSIYIKGVKASPSICYELLFSDYIRKNTDYNSSFLINTSNDYWLKGGKISFQMLQIARVRAVEVGKPLLRVTSNGYSAIIDKSGSLVSISYDDDVRGGLKFSSKTTIYHRYGLLPFIFLAVFYILCFLFFNKKLISNNFIMNISTKNNIF